MPTLRNGEEVGKTAPEKGDPLGGNLEYSPRISKGKKKKKKKKKRKKKKKKRKRPRRPGETEMLEQEPAPLEVQGIAL